MKLFIGAFNNPDSSNFIGSGAGAKVQCEIINSLRSFDCNLKALVMPEVPSWPGSKLITDSVYTENVKLLPVLNISFLKRFSFFIQVFSCVCKNRCSTIFSYNSSLVACVFSFLFRFLDCKRVLILQDVFVPEFKTFYSFFNPKSIISYLYIKILPFCYDLYIPITDSCITGLNLPAKRSEVFSGAIPFYRFDEMQLSSSPSKEYAVFAGALEPYNGFDLLLENWPFRNEYSFELHIFGSGSLSDYAIEMCKKNINLIYHGFKSPDFVDEYLLKSKINFCFRYSKGLDQKYFFPSKFFDLILLPGFLVCNRFDNMPSDLVDCVVFSNEDLSDLVEIIRRCSILNRNVGGLFDLALSKYTWHGFLDGYCRRNFP